MIRSAILFSWTTWNDENISDIIANIKATQSTIALISALLLNTFTSFFREGDDNVYIFIFFCASAFALMATLLSVVFLLQINELASADEARQFVSRMGRFLEFNIYSLIAAGTAAMAGVCYWIYLHVDDMRTVTWMVGAIVPFGIPCLTYPYLFGVQTLWAITETTKEMRSSSTRSFIVLNQAEIAAKFIEYTTENGGIELACPAAFLDFLRVEKETDGGVFSLPLAYVTEERAKVFFKSQINSHLQADRAGRGGVESGGAAENPKDGCVIEQMRV
jgi:hypothetical protein